VARRVHALNVGAKRAPERFKLIDRDGVIGALIRERRQDLPAIVEKCCETRIRAGMFGAGERMSWDEIDVSRQRSGAGIHDGLLHGADVSDDRADLQSARARSCRSAHRTDGDSEDNEVSVRHRALGVVEHFAKAKVSRALADSGVCVIERDCVGGAMFTRRERDRCADQTCAYDSNALENYGH
jgi:hypothetical protein